MALNMKKYKILCGNVHEYDVEFEFLETYSKEVRIYYSLTEHWTEQTKGQLAIKAIDTGNDIKISNFKGVRSKNNVTLDYPYSSLLRMVLNIIEYGYQDSKETTFSGEYRLIEENIVLKPI